MKADEDIKAMFAATFEQADGRRGLWVGHRSQGGNYVAKVQGIPAAAITPGVVNIATIAHDDWCLIWWTGYCNCNPDISVAPAVAEEP